MIKRTPKKKQKQVIADGGDFVSHALGMMEPGESVQTQMFEENSRSMAPYMQKYRAEHQKFLPVIYFVQEVSDEGFIKIGYSTNFVLRLSTIANANPRPIQILLVMKGSHKLEKELHQQFVTCNYRAEWFNPSEELLAYIEEHKSEDLPGERPTKGIRTGRPKKWPK